MRNTKVNIDCKTCVGRPKGIFCALKEEPLERLNSEKTASTYKKGQNLFVEGNIPFGIFCIHSGKVKVTKNNANGKETIVRIADQGDVLGYRSLFSETPFTASATVLEEGLICFVPKKTIMDLVQNDPSLAFSVIKKLSVEMGAAEEKVASLARKSLRERFAEMLLLLKESYGIEKDGQYTLDIKLTREEMSSMVGAAPENIIRLVTEFKNENLISQQGKQLKILNLKGIEDQAGLDI